MMYIKKQDYEYICNKYHDAKKAQKGDAQANDLSFNTSGLGTERFCCQERIFDSLTGLSPEDIIYGIQENDKKYEKCLHPVRKARAFEYVLENTRISCNIKDRFPAVCSIDRPINKTLVAKWRDEVFKQMIPDTAIQREEMENDGAVTIWPDYDHSVPMWERIFSLGFSGLLAEAMNIRNEFFPDNIISDEEIAYFESINITYKAIIKFIGRLADLAERENPRMAAALRKIEVGPPTTLYEALLTDYIYFILCEHIEGLQVRSLSNIDVILYPYYQNDIENGISETEIRMDLAYFLMQFTAIGNYWGQPVYLGGTKENGESVINPFSYIFLDVYDKMKIYNPKIQIKLSENTPKDFVYKALDMIRRGNNSIVFVCERTMIKALMNTGISLEEARKCVISGCYEYSVRESMNVGMNYFNLLKPLEYTLSGGYDGITGKLAGIKTSTNFRDFQEFYDTYLKQLCKLIDDNIRVANIIDNYLAVINPQPMLSATFIHSLQKAKDPLEGGAVESNTTIYFGFIANLADSLTVIKELVFDKKELSIAELKQILDNNYNGHELLRQRILNKIEHYGNNKKVPDEFACQVVKFVSDYVNGRPDAKKRGGVWNVGFHVARQSYDQGKITAASPDGRLRGEELLKNISASLGRSREGATAAILSATKIDASQFVGDACLDLGLHPSAVSGADGLSAMYGLLMTFEKRGGHAIHINVFNAQTLRDAQKHPEKYEDLQIRVCGWNVLFNQISPEEQEGFIRQAEALI